MKQSYFDQVADYRTEWEWHRRLLAARVPRSLVIKAGTLSALGGAGALAQILAACTTGGSGEREALTGVSTEGTYKWSRYPLIEKYNYRNLPHTV